MHPKLVQINDHIANMVNVDLQNQQLRSTLEKTYAHKGADWLDHYSKFLRTYIQFAPSNLATMWQAANEKGKSNEMAPIAQMLIGYFFKADDYIPDRLGLWGWLDDAYLCNYTLELINQRCQEQFGHPLIDYDFNKSNGIAANFLGNLTFRIQQEAQHTVKNNWHNVEEFANALLGGLLLYSLMGGGNNYSGGGGGGSYSQAVDRQLAAISSGTSMYPF